MNEILNEGKLAKVTNPAKFYLNRIRSLDSVRVEYCYER